MGELNWFAVIVATLAYYLLGAVWFTPLFGRAWDMSIGFVRPKGHRFPPIYYVTPLVSSFVVTFATAVLVYALDIGDFPEALLLGVVAGVGYAAAVSVTNAVTPNTPRPLVLGAVTGAYHLAGIIGASSIIFAMK